MAQRHTRSARDHGVYPGSPRVIAADDVLRRIRGEDALRVISLLARNGHEAYLVGGCVRDLLVGRSPKDFDVATNAHPRQVRRLFPRNSHIIGRRFRLVHVRYGSASVIETATFRKEPSENGAGDDDDLLIVEDNTYGTAAEDAKRRDFTVNGLFLDPPRNTIIDYVGGLDDLEAGVLRTIGDPLVRMAEDPVRILRAIKFATRLGFQIEDMTWEAMCCLGPELERSAAPRVLEEILRLMRSGTSLGAFKKLRSCGVLGVILPRLDEHLGPAPTGDQGETKRVQRFFRLLGALDADVHAGYEPSAALCVALLHGGIVHCQADPETRTWPGKPEELLTIAARVLEPLAARARLSRKEAARARRILALQTTFLRTSSKTFRPRLFCLSEDFPEALAYFRLRAAARGEGWDLYEGWVDRLRAAEAMSPEELEAERRMVRGSRRRRRRRRRRS